jgi:hypothetical protein
MQRGLADEIELTERNAHPLWTAVYRLQMAWLSAEAFAFGRVEEIASDALARGREAGHALSQTLGAMLLATARLGRGEVAAAEVALQEIDGRLARSGVEVEWPLRPRLELTRTDLALARGALDEARRHADALLELASATGERTYQALARRARVLAALRSGATAEAATEIEAALATLHDADAPLAAWRVHVAAAEVDEARRRKAKAREHRAAAAAVLRRLERSLAAGDPLRQTLLDADVVRRTLASEA